MLEGVVIQELRQIQDNRGWLAEVFREDELPRILMPQMGYTSATMPGASRGPHEHLKQTDFFFFPGISEFRVYLWDNNPQSKTCGESQQVETKEGVPSIIIISPRIVHAYRNIGNSLGFVFNFPNRLYAGKDKKEKVDEIRYENLEDSRFRID